MPMMSADVETQYNTDRNLIKEDVNILMEWANQQPDLPKINESQTILFLHNCCYSSEAAKTRLKNFFRFRTHNPDMFTNRHPASPAMRTIMDHNLIAALPRRTPQDYTIVFVKFLENNSNNFNLLNEFKYFEMVVATNLNSERLSGGHVLLIDIQGITVGHLFKLRPILLKKFFYYLQEAIPLRLKGLHFFNVRPIMDKLLVLLKPFMKKELIDVLCLHDTLDSLQEFIPIDCLPEEYGGSAGSIVTLHEKIKGELNQNPEFLVGS